jgi:cytochrome P450
VTATSTTSAFPWPPGPAGTPPAAYAHLRETEPVAGVRLADDTPIWLATRYEDVHRVLTDPSFSRHRAATLPGAGLGRGQGAGIVDLDPPEHERYRTPVVAAFDPARVRRHNARITSLAEEILDQLAAGPGVSGPVEVDLVSGFTSPLAGRVTCELLGLTGDGWRQITADVEAQVLAGSLPPAQVAQAQERIRTTLEALLELRREQPADDVTTALLSTDGATDPALERPELVTLLQGLVMSGFIGVRDLLARHLFAVLADPALATRLRDVPSLVPRAVEELLRYYPSSNDGLLRMATRDVELGGTHLPAGALVLPLVSAASRDPRHVAEPDRIDIDRTERAGPGIAFGAGPHACPAADLARTELCIGITTLLSRFPDLRLAVPADAVEHNSDLIPLGIPRLPVFLGRPVDPFRTGPREPATDIPTGEHQ